MKKFLVLLFLCAAIVCAQTKTSDEIPAQAGSIRVKPVQHASLILQYGGKTIAVDPVGQGGYGNAPHADIILITDIHKDHLDPATINQLKKADTKVVVPQAAKKDVPEGEVMSNGETKTVEGISIEAVPMYNLVRGPSATTKYHDKGRGNGYIVTLGGKRIYIAGDTECTPEMKALKNIDAAFVPMNLPYTMPPEEAAACVQVFKPKIVYPYHYRGSDLSKFEEPLKGSGVEVRELKWYEEKK